MEAERIRQALTRIEGASDRIARAADRLARNASEPVDGELRDAARQALSDLDRLIAELEG